MFKIIQRYLARRKKERRIAWKALERFFDLCEIRDEIRPPLMHVSHKEYGEWCRRGYASRKGMKTALKYFRLYKALRAQVGDDETVIRYWLTTPNLHFSPHVPIEYLLVGGEEHLDNVLAYLERFAAK